MSVRLGTAGWAAPAAVRHRFPEAANGLTRYAGRFDAVEINSTFYRSHRPATWARWVADTPDDFRFAVKLPKTITHERRLVDVTPLLETFLAEVAQLGGKLGPVLIQLPPSLAFEAEVAGPFLQAYRDRYSGLTAIEPRHPSWFDTDPAALMSDLRIARVAADPARVPEAARPGGWPGLTYWRLHGSPRMYWSSYDDAYLATLAEQLGAHRTSEVWCIFDNTTSGAAAQNALDMQERLG